MLQQGQMQGKQLVLHPIAAFSLSLHFLRSAGVPTNTNAENIFNACAGRAATRVCTWLMVSCLGPLSLSRLQGPRREQ
jgi:hypothetical protein